MVAEMWIVKRYSYRFIREHAWNRSKHDVQARGMLECTLNFLNLQKARSVYFLNSYKPVVATWCSLPLFLCVCINCRNEDDITNFPFACHKVVVQNICTRDLGDIPDTGLHWQQTLSYAQEKASSYHYSSEKLCRQIGWQAGDVWFVWPIFSSICHCILSWQWLFQWTGNENESMTEWKRCRIATVP